MIRRQKELLLYDAAIFSTALIFWVVILNHDSHRHLEPFPGTFTSAVSVFMGESVHERSDFSTEQLRPAAMIRRATMVFSESLERCFNCRESLMRELVGGESMKVLGKRRNSRRTH